MGSLSSHYGYTSNIHEFPMKNRPEDIVSVYSNGPFPPRAGLSAVLYKNKIYIFGGGCYKGTQLTVFNDLIEFDIGIL